MSKLSRLKIKLHKELRKQARVSKVIASYGGPASPTINKLLSEIVKENERLEND